MPSWAEIAVEQVERAPVSMCLDLNRTSSKCLQRQLQIFYMAADLRSYRNRAGTAGHPRLLDRSPIRFHIDGRECRRTDKVRTRGPQAETRTEVLNGRGPHSTREALTSLLKWQEDQLFVGSLRPLLAHLHSESVRAVWVLSDRVHQGTERSTLTRGSQAELSERSSNEGDLTKGPQHESQRRSLAQNQAVRLTEAAMKQR